MISTINSFLEKDTYPLILFILKSNTTGPQVCLTPPLGVDMHAACMSVAFQCYPVFVIPQLGNTPQNQCAIFHSRSFSKYIIPRILKITCLISWGRKKELGNGIFRDLNCWGLKRSKDWEEVTGVLSWEAILPHACQAPFQELLSLTGSPIHKSLLGL